MTKKSKITILAVIIATASLLLILYSSNSLERFGIGKSRTQSYETTNERGLDESGECPPGTEFYETTNDWELAHFGYSKGCRPTEPTNLNGPCDKQTDCGSARCVLVDENRTSGRGICSSEPYDCGYAKRADLSYKKKVAAGDYIIDKDGKIQERYCIE